jgi:maleylacetate reductase
VAPEPLGRIADAVGAGDDLAGFVWDLVASAGLPLRLADVGVGPADIDRAVEIATTADDQDDPRLAGNPAPVTEAAVRAILAAVAAGARPGGAG